jgi:hypothetical protein
MIDGEVAHYHLGAYSETGYRFKASFAIFRTAIDEFARRGLRWLSLGAGPGIGEEEGGLTRFKHGWATGTRPVYFCGRVFDRDAYRLLPASIPADPQSYFPAYRRGEFR